MRKINTLLALSAVLLSLAACTKNNDGPLPGKSVGEIYVTSQSGAKTVLVSLSGLWRVCSQEDWIKTDVNGRNGIGAVTLSYGSNESDFVHTNGTRRGAVVIEDQVRNIADTLYIRQQGTPDGKEYSSTPQDSYIEFVDTDLTKKVIVYASFKGSDDTNAAKNWLKSCGADIVALTWTKAGIDALASDYQSGFFSSDSVAIISTNCKSMDLIVKTTEPSSVAVDVDGINFQVADFSRAQAAYSQMLKVLDAGYNCPGVSSKWLIGGTFYQLSVMEIGYPDTPSWYPSHPSDSSFDADRYAQDNQLTDCVWMTSRKFNSTFTGGGKSWRADYAYASNSVWNSVVSVELGKAPISGALHSTITITVKY